MIVLHRESWPKLAGFVRLSWVPITGLLTLWVLLLAALLGVYREANEGFVRKWDECLDSLPSASDWLVPPASSLHAACHLVKPEDVNPDRNCCPGWVVIGLAAGGLGLSIGQRRLFSKEQSRLVLALLGTAVTLAVLSLRDVGEGALWWWVYQWVPGATAIRAVGRITLTVLLFALMGGLLAVQAVLRAPQFAPRARWVVGSLVLLVGAAEQIAAHLPSFEAASFYPRAEALAIRVRPCTALYVAHRSDMYWYTSELLAMWAGLHANRPVVNGYSGRSPVAYPIESMPPGRVFGWLAVNMPPDKLWPGKLLYVEPAQKEGDEYRGVLLEADWAPLASAQ
jgi:hypothetical protein